MPEFSGISLNDVVVESDIFQGMEFCACLEFGYLCEPTLTYDSSDFSRPQITYAYRGQGTVDEAVRLRESFLTVHGCYITTPIPRTKAHGGTLVQIARNQPSIYVIYGGDTTRECWLWSGGQGLIICSS
jgi:hypothetical protein